MSNPVAGSLVVLPLLLLCACDEKAAETLEDAKLHGRYAGIGVFEASQIWQKVAGVPEAKDPAQAKTADDAHIIVVVDTETGEVRQCGDVSGYCLAMNPWKGTPGALPARLTEHVSAVPVEHEEAQTAAAKVSPAGGK